MQTALLVIDFINGICGPGAYCEQYLTEHPEVIENTNLLIATAREQKVPIFFIRLEFDHHYTGLPMHAPIAQQYKAEKKFLLGARDTAFIKQLNYQASDILLNKKFGDPFYGSHLLEKCHQHKIEKLIFTGVSTNNAILYGVNTATLNNFHTTVVSDATGARDPQTHQTALTWLANGIATEIKTTKEINL